jgi:hypothetical protein
VKGFLGGEKKATFPPARALFCRKKAGNVATIWIKNSKRVAKTRKKAYLCIAIFRRSREKDEY